MAVHPSSERNWLYAAIVAAILVPVLSIGLNMPFWLACLIAGLVLAGVLVLLAPDRPLRGLHLRGIARGRLDLARDLLSDAAPQVDRIEKAARSVKTAAIGAQLRHLAGVARDILKRIEQNPSKLDPVRRFLTYYLPRAADLADAYTLLETQAAPKPDRLRETKDMIARLDTAFTHYADSLVDADLGTLDIDLRLLKKSLDEDLGPFAPATREDGRKQ